MKKISNSGTPKLQLFTTSLLRLHEDSLSASPNSSLNFNLSEKTPSKDIQIPQDSKTSA